VIDIDATLVTAHMNKGAAGNLMGRWGYHPIGAWLDDTKEALAAILRPATPYRTPPPITAPYWI